MLNRPSNLIQSLIKLIKIFQWFNYSQVRFLPRRDQTYSVKNLYLMLQKSLLNCRGKKAKLSDTATGITFDYGLSLTSENLNSLFQFDCLTVLFYMCIKIFYNQVYVIIKYNNYYVNSGLPSKKYIYITKRQLMKIQIILWTVQLIHKRLCQANLKNVPVQHYTAIINRFHFHSQKCKLRSKPKKISFFYYYNSLLYNSCAFLIFFNHVQITQEASFVIWLYIDAKIQLQVGLLMYHIQHTWPSLYFIFTNTNSFLPGLHELFWYLQLNSNHCHYCPRLLHSQKST